MHSGVHFLRTGSTLNSMAKKDDDLPRLLAVLGLLFLGAKAMKELTTPTGPCYSCGTQLRVGTKQCPTCGVALVWRKPDEAGQHRG